jgi:hypothetical protein
MLLLTAGAGRDRQGRVSATRTGIAACSLLSRFKTETDTTAFVNKCFIFRRKVLHLSSQKTAAENEFVKLQNIIS